jgi:HAMP domain-containing protein
VPVTTNGPQRALDRAELLRALHAFQRGDYSVRMPAGLPGIDGQIAQAFNDLARMSQELARSASEDEARHLRDEHFHRGASNDL